MATTATTTTITTRQKQGEEEEESNFRTTTVASSSSAKAKAESSLSLSSSSSSMSSTDNSSSTTTTTNIKIVSVNDYQKVAKCLLSKALYEYISSGTDDEQSLQENGSAYKTWYLRPRVMKPVSSITTTCNIFRSTSSSTRSSSSSSRIRRKKNSRYYNIVTSMPIFASCAGVHALVCNNNTNQKNQKNENTNTTLLRNTNNNNKNENNHDNDTNNNNCCCDGECSTARACGNLGIMFALSQHSTRTIEEVASLNNNNAPSSNTTTTTTTRRRIQFYQAYLLKDRSITRQLIERALHVGYKGIILTVDSVCFGSREADIRNGFNTLPKPHRLANYDYDFKKNNNSNNNNNKKTKDLGSTSSSSSLDKTYNSQTYTAWDQNTELMFEQDVTWDDVTWIRNEVLDGHEHNDIPLVVKGIMTGEDAILAVNAGADCIMVSNHGGRQLDSCLSTIDVLPEIVSALEGYDIPIWIDGGIRRGTDILKALALGASAVGIGRPIFYALACGGEDAVRDMFRILQRELIAAMSLCGCSNIESIDSSNSSNSNSSSLVTRHPNNGISPSNYIRSNL